MRALAGTLIALISTTAWADEDASAEDRPITPVVSENGKTIIVPYVDDDGARGAPNLTILAYDRRGTQTRKIAVVDVERGPVPGGAAARSKYWASQRPHAMTELTPTTPDQPDEHRVYQGLTVDLSPTGTLTVTPDGKKPIVRRGRWRTQPDAATKAAMQGALDKGDIRCFNPASIGAVYIDEERRAAVITIPYRGNDTCWEPAHDLAVVTW